LLLVHREVWEKRLYTLFGYMKGTCVVVYSS